MEAEAVSKGAEIGWSIYEVLAPCLAAIVAWVSARLAGLIRAKTRNEMVEGILLRLNESVAEAVKAVNQQTREILGRAREPDSPGGRKLTMQEARLLREHALKYIRSYWGLKGIKELARILGLELGGELDSYLLNKIEAYVGREKSNRIRADPRRIT